MGQGLQRLAPARSVPAEVLRQVLGGAIVCMFAAQGPHNGTFCNNLGQFGVSGITVGQAKHLQLDAAALPSARQAT